MVDLKNNLSKPSLKIAVVVVVLIAAVLWVFSTLVVLKLFGKYSGGVSQNTTSVEKQRVVDEESVVIDVVDRVSPSVVSIAVKDRVSVDFFGVPRKDAGESGIGSGFVVSAD